MSIRLGATKNTILCAVSPNIEEGRDDTIKHMPRTLHSECVGRGFLVDFFAHVRSRRLKASRLRRLWLSRLVAQIRASSRHPLRFWVCRWLCNYFWSRRQHTPDARECMQTHAGLFRRLPLHQLIRPAASTQSTNFQPTSFPRIHEPREFPLEIVFPKEFPNPWKRLLRHCQWFRGDSNHGVSTLITWLYYKYRWKDFFFLSIWRFFLFKECSPKFWWSRFLARQFVRSFFKDSWLFCTALTHLLPGVRWLIWVGLGLYFVWKGPNFVSLFALKRPKFRY